MSCESPDHPGTCAGTSTDTCGGTAAKTCSAGLFCDLASKCGTIDDAAGSCVAKRSDCGADYMPVCGCDGKTYPGDCWRIQAGVLKASDGACASDGGTTTPACPFDCRTSSSGVTGWYSGDSLICAAACTGDTATCDKAGTKSEGCYATGPAGAGKGCSGTGSLILYATCSK